MLPKIVLISFTLSLPLLFLYFLEPHIVEEETRSSQSAISIDAIYSGTETCLTLHRLQNKQPGTAIHPAYPQPMARPETKEITNNTRIRLQGYPYQKISSNLLSNKKIHSYSPRFDVIAWEIIDENPQKKQSSYNSSDHAPAQFQRQNSCK